MTGERSAKNDSASHSVSHKGSRRELDESLPSKVSLVRFIWMVSALSPRSEHSSVSEGVPSDHASHSSSSSCALIFLTDSSSEVAKLSAFDCLCTSDSHISWLIGTVDEMI